MFFIFQQSKIWESGNPVDSRQPEKRVKAKSEERARKRLPKPELGRVWVLVRAE